MSVQKSIPLQGASLGAAGVSNAPTLRATINTTSNWTVPTGVKAIMFVLAGGGGGGSARAGDGGAGGGAGGVLIRAVPVTPGSNLGITIGAGGTGATSGNNDNGNAGGSSSISVGNILFTIAGATKYTTISGYGQYAGTAGSTVNINSNTAGTAPIVPTINTNFVLEIAPILDTLQSGNDRTNTMGPGSINSTPSMGSGSYRGSLFGLAPVYNGNQTPRQRTNFVISNNNQINSTFSFGGGGAPSAPYNNFSNRWVDIYTPTHGEGGLVGGGGASYNSTGYAGRGGAGMGGLGGSANLSGGWRGGGGGGGLTGAGNTANTASGGNGGTGGGGGGGAGSNGNAGSGGAGACLIYY